MLFFAHKKRFHDFACKVRPDLTPPLPGVTLAYTEKLGVLPVEGAECGEPEVAPAKYLYTAQASRNFKELGPNKKACSTAAAE